MCFFFQAEDGIRDRDVTGVQTCALPISAREGLALMRRRLVNPGLEAHQRKAFARRLVLDACEDGAPDVLAARFRDDAHALYFPVPQFDAQGAAADRIDAATRYKKTDVRRAKRLDVEEMVALGRV